MRYKIFVGINIVVIVIMLCVGIVFRLNVKNTYNTEEGRDKLSIAYYMSTLNENLETQGETLKSSPIIVVAKALGKSEYVFGNLKQEVYIEKVIKGEDRISAGKKVYIVGTGQRYENDYGEMSVDTKFLNFMQKDDRYLIFIDQKIEWDIEDVDIYRMNQDALTMQYLNLDRNQSKVNDTTEVWELYKNVKDMEFYTNNEEGLRIFNEIKQKLIEKYCN